MCDSKEEGGRRCPSHTPAARAAKRRAAKDKRLAEAAVEGTTMVSPTPPDAWVAEQSPIGKHALAEAWKTADSQFAARVLADAGDVRAGEPEFRNDYPPSELFTNQPGCWANQEIEKADGSQMAWGDYERTHWSQAIEATVVEPTGDGYFKHGGVRVGVLRYDEDHSWMGYHAAQDEHGMWVVKGRVSSNLAQAAGVIPAEHRTALGFPAEMQPRPSFQDLMTMFPPKREALKAAWADHDPEYAAQFDTAATMGALGEAGMDWAAYRSDRRTPSEWANDSGFSAVPLVPEGWGKQVGAWTHYEHEFDATDDAGNPVEWDPTNVARVGDTGGEWCPVAMERPRRKSVERRKKRARTFYYTDRYAAYGIARNETTGEWAVYNTTDTSTSEDWQYGRDKWAWNTRVVISKDINKAAAHLTDQQRDALGLPTIATETEGDTTDKAT